MAENLENVSGEYFLNPSVKKDGVYKVHFNPVENGRWKYGKHSPESYPTDGKPDHEYIFNTRPVAFGITAFFIKKNPHDFSPTSSLLSILQRGERPAIYLWYEEYYENQIAFAREINETKTKAQGQLTSEQLTDTFNRDHLESEQRYYSKYVGFFNLMRGEDEQIAEIMREYVEGYLAWVNEKIKDMIHGYDGALSPEKLKSLYNRLLEKKILKEGDILTRDFVNVFSGGYFSDRVEYKGKKSELARIIIAIMGEVLVEDVNKKFIFPNKAPFDSNDKNVDAGIVIEELKSL